jgi:methionyl aminopeptidase
MSVTIKTPEEIAKMRVAGRMAAEVLEMIGQYVQPGVTTAELDKICHDHIVNVQKAIPACLGYRGYTKTVCISPNHVVCHGIPGERTLREGDIVNIDVTVIVDGWHGDTSRMYSIGSNVPRKAQRLMDVTYEDMMRGINTIKPGTTLGDLGYAIQSFAEAERTSIVREFCGHGLGRIFHDAPNILHFGKPGQGDVLKAGMIFTVEPMLNAGAPSVKVLNDGWTAVTKDKSLSAQYEHSVGVTEDGVVIFTKSPAGLDEPHKLNATP